jgi:hypothetical protein
VLHTIYLFIKLRHVHLLLLLHSPSDKLLAPVVQSAVLHPTLGCVAVQRAPPLALRQAANIMQQRLGQISAPEAAISRRTASVPLLRLMHSARPEAGWPGGKVAALHTGLNFWQTAAG